MQLFSRLFYDNIWPNYVYGAWAAGNENGKTGNNKVSDKSFPTVTVPPLGVRVSVCVPAIECVPVCVCECESDTLIDVITCALNIYCIGRRHGTFFFTSPCECVCHTHKWLPGLSVYIAFHYSGLAVQAATKAETVSEKQKAIAGRCLRQRRQQELFFFGLPFFSLAWKIEKIV